MPTLAKTVLALLLWPLAAWSQAPTIPGGPASTVVAPTQPARASTPSWLDRKQLRDWIVFGRALQDKRPDLFDGAEGVLVTQVMANGQAAGAGIEPGDLLISYGDKPLGSAKPLLVLTDKTPSEQIITVRWLHRRPGDAPLDRATRTAQVHGGSIGASIRDLADTVENRMWTLRLTGRTARNRSRYDEAMGQFRQGLDLAEGADDPRWRGQFLRDLGIVAFELGRYQEALEYSRQALASDRALRDTGNEAADLHSLGNVCLELGRYSEALQYYTEALAKSDQAHKGAELGALGGVYQSLGRYPEALN